jgi:tetratricopeptide (TPR) repeat protein
MSRILATVLLVVSPAATAAAEPPAPAPSGEPTAQSAAGPPVAREEILRLSPEMAAFLDENVAGASPELRLSSLMDALFERGRLDVSYSNVRTTTAAQTFELRSGNCLSFTLMVAAMVRHLGLAVRFREVGEVLSWNRRGAVLLNNKHLYAEVPAGRDVVAVDFLPGADKRYRRPRLVDEDRVIAHFYSNLGAESLAAGEPERALAELQQAIAIDPTFGWAWTNLGVVHRALGRPEQAEHAYLEAFRLDPADATPLSNLAGLYAGQGKERKAGRFERRVERHRRRSPFHHYRLSLQASAAGRATEAITHMRRAVRRAPEDPAFRSRLAELYHAGGRPRRAERSLELARHFSSDPEAKERLGRLLEAWRSGGAEAAGVGVEAGG